VTGKQCGVMWLVGIGNGISAGRNANGRGVEGKGPFPLSLSLILCERGLFP